MSAAVVSLDAYRQRRAATRLVRAKRSDVCCYCRQECDIRQRLAYDSATHAVAHLECWIREHGCEP